MRVLKLLSAVPLLVSGQHFEDFKIDFSNLKFDFDVPSNGKLDTNIPSSGLNLFESKKDFVNKKAACTSDLSVEKIQVFTEPVDLGDTLEYRVTVLNGGKGPAKDLRILESLNPALIVNSISGVRSNLISASCDVLNNEIECNLNADLPAGFNWEISIPVVAGTSSSQFVTNQVTVTASCGAPVKSNVVTTEFLNPIAASSSSSLTASEVSHPEEVCFEEAITEADNKTICRDLYSGRGELENDTPIGTSCLTLVEVLADGDVPAYWKLLVTTTIDESVDLWIREHHFELAIDISDAAWRTKNGNPKPGRFTYKASNIVDPVTGLPGVKSHTFEIIPTQESAWQAREGESEAAVLCEALDLYAADHVALNGRTTDADGNIIADCSGPLGCPTGWGWQFPFNEYIEGGPRRSWAGYLVFRTLCDDDCGDNGGTGGINGIEYGSGTGYSFLVPSTVDANDVASWPVNQGLAADDDNYCTIQNTEMTSFPSPRYDHYNAQNVNSGGAWAWISHWEPNGSTPARYNIFVGAGQCDITKSAWTGTMELSLNTATDEVTLSFDFTTTPVPLNTVTTIQMFIGAEPFTRESKKGDSFTIRAPGAKPEKDEGISEQGLYTYTYTLKDYVFPAGSGNNSVDGGYTGAFTGRFVVPSGLTTSEKQAICGTGGVLRDDIPGSAATWCVPSTANKYANLFTEIHFDFL